MSDSDAVKPLVNGKMDNIDDEEQKLSVAKEELNKLTKQLEKAEYEKSRLQLAKLSAEDSKKEASKNVMVLQRQGEQRQEEFSKTVKGIQNDISMLEKGNKDLMEKLKKSQAKLQAKKSESATLQQRFKIYVQIPEKKVKFTCKEEDSDDSGQHIKGVFTIAQRPSVLLKGGQALITFEEEKVAAQILKMAKCTVSCDKDKVHVKPKSLTLDPFVKFELHLDVSTKTLSFSNVPFTLSEERMRDRLEISFSKPSRGGGEVQRVDYDKHTGKGQITFLNSGVAERLALKRKYIVDMDREVNVKVDLVYMYKLKKFQTFCGTPTRTILLCGITDFQDEEDLQDHLEIHFQKPSNYGGEVECIKYVSGGNEVKAFFTEDMAEMEA
ncbi:N-myc-interactor [Oncorhynchus keta]|uniref:N-myc-interactor n=1 Tax=Oncorhynchus keta TaxID=8018 RepID=UPI00227CB1DC|nr:N-myc-interactor [Oncorhynchus keta]XP_052378891.1 N-myc-interactor [Oncorhynchus keta]